MQTQDLNGRHYEFSIELNADNNFMKRRHLQRFPILGSLWPEHQCLKKCPTQWELVYCKFPTFTAVATNRGCVKLIQAVDAPRSPGKPSKTSNMASTRCAILDILNGCSRLASSLRSLNSPYARDKWKRGFNAFIPLFDLHISICFCFRLALLSRTAL